MKQIKNTSILFSFKFYIMLFVLFSPPYVPNPWSANPGWVSVNLWSHDPELTFQPFTCFINPLFITGLVSLENEFSEFENDKFYNGIIQTWIFCIIFDLLSKKTFELVTIQFVKTSMPLLRKETGKNDKCSIYKPCLPLGLLTIIGFEFSMKLSVTVYIYIVITGVRIMVQFLIWSSRHASDGRNPETRRHKLIPCSQIKLISLYHNSTLKWFKKNN